jgi:hypothetical protein
MTNAINLKNFFLALEWDEGFSEVDISLSLIIVRGLLGVDEEATALWSQLSICYRF